MGDTGSLIVGFLLSFFTIEFLRLNVSFRNDPNAFFNAPIIVMVVLIVPIFDTLRVFIVRILNGKSPFVADRNHVPVSYTHLDVYKRQVGRDKKDIMEHFLQVYGKDLGSPNRPVNV